MEYLQLQNVLRIQIKIHCHYKHYERQRLLSILITDYMAGIVSCIPKCFLSEFNRRNKRSAARNNAALFLMKAKRLRFLCRRFDVYCSYCDICEQ